MPARNVYLTEELDHFVLAKIDSGRYENASEVIRAVLRALEREEQQFEAKLAALRTAIDQGDASGVAPGDSFQCVRRRLKSSKGELGVSDPSSAHAARRPILTALERLQLIEGAWPVRFQKP